MIISKGTISEALFFVQYFEYIKKTLPKNEVMSN